LIAGELDDVIGDIRKSAEHTKAHEEADEGTNYDK